jgi:HAD superfamily hydrolase (TIGR01509 family)
MGQAILGPIGSLPQPVAGLLFDMGDVIYDTTLWRRWLFQLLRRLGLKTSYRVFYRVWECDYLADVHRGRRDFREAFQSFLHSVGLGPAQIQELETACMARRKRWEDTVRPLPGVRATLIRLHASGSVLGVLTDSEHPSSVLRRQLDRFGLGRVFPTVLSSIDLRRTKPDAACYLTALKAMGLCAEQTAYVGHNAEDLAGAARLGMHTIGFNCDVDASADVYLARFEDLLTLVSTPLCYAAAG